MIKKADHKKMIYYKQACKDFKKIAKINLFVKINLINEIISNNKEPVSNQNYYLLN